MPATEVDSIIDGGPVAGGDTAKVSIRVLTPSETRPKPIIVYFHGGGWMVGSVNSHLGHARRLCVEAGAVVVSVDYRLAPEHRFPAAFDDAMAAVSWAARNAAGLGADAELLAVAGDSAGGQLAASVALASRTDGPSVAAQLLLYPVTDVSGRYDDPLINARFTSRLADGFSQSLTLQDMAEFASCYVGAEAAGDWRVSPLQSGDLRDVPPAVVHTAELDRLRSEGDDYAAALNRSGVRVMSRVHGGLDHAYFGLGGISLAADTAASQASSDLRTILDLEP